MATEFEGDLAVLGRELADRLEKTGPPGSMDVETRLLTEFLSKTLIQHARSLVRASDVATCLSSQLSERLVRATRGLKWATVTLAVVTAFLAGAAIAEVVLSRI